jgi:iron complex transport system substrate-binding protein
VVLGRRAALAACAAAPLVAAGALARRSRGAVVGARPFADSRVEGTAFPRRLVDAAGETRLLPRPPARIVSTYLACDEVLAELVPPDRMAGVSIFADDPGTSRVVGAFPPRVARLRAEPESVLALEPDLVCVSAFTEIEALRLLAGTGLPILRWSRLDSFADVLGGVRLLGAAVGEEARADAVVQAAEARLDAVERRVHGAARPRALFFGLPGFTLGKGTLVDEIITRAGGRNAAAELGIQGPSPLGLEMVLALEPDVILMPRYGRDESGRAQLGAAAARVQELPASLLTSVSHHAAEGVVAVARVLHPERI